MKIYTRSGDEGRTALFGGQRLPKHDLRIHAYGEVDELNACLGACVLAAPEDAAALQREMARLFDLGAHLATLPEAPEKLRASLPAWEAGCLARLEGEIDRWQAGLPELKSFVLPGGSEAAVRLHRARAVCRRAERALSRLAGREPVDDGFLAYLNRLGDWLFVLARRANRRAGTDEILWRPASPRG